MPSQNNECIIRLDNIGVSFGSDIILDDVTLSVNKGDFVAITGPNGGGKTTLLRVILKLLKPSHGRLQYLRDGVEVRHLPIGYLPQKSMIDTKFPITVEQLMLSGLLGRSVWHKPKGDRERLEEVAELTGAKSFLHKPIGNLSGGQLQRALMGRALISRPEVLVLDEPLSYVDKQFERQIYSLMEQLSHTTTILLVSHEMTYISALASRHLIVDHKVHPCSGLHHYIPGDCE